MSINYPAVYDLFPIPLYVNKYTGDTTELVKYFDSCVMLPAKGPYGRISENSYILDNPICKEFNEWAIKCFEEMAVNVMRYKFTSLQFAQSWLTYKEPGEFHKAHTHPNTLLAGVFYYDFQPNDSAICFSKPVSSVGRVMIEPSLHEDYQEHRYSQEEIYFTPENNTFIIFPSWLTHGVPPNRTSHVRKALGVNVLTRHTLGDRETISEIIFSRYE